MFGSLIALVIYVVLLRLGIYEPACSMKNGLRWWQPTTIGIVGFIAYVVLLAGLVPFIDTESTFNALIVLGVTLIPSSLAIYLGLRS